MQNKYLEDINKIEDDYTGQIVKILNAARMAISEVTDSKLEGNRAKYQLPIVNQAMEQIEAIRNGYFTKAESKIAAYKKALTEEKPDTRSTSEKLLDAINLSNRIAIEQMKAKALTNDELFQIGGDTMDKTLVQVIKAELSTRAAAMDNDNPDKITLQQGAHRMKAITDNDLIAEAERALAEHSTYREQFLPGTELNEKLTIKNPREFLMQDVEKVAEYHE